MHVRREHLLRDVPIAAGDGAGVVEADLAMSAAGLPGSDVDREVAAGRTAAVADERAKAW